MTSPHPLRQPVRPADWAFKALFSFAAAAGLAACASGQGANSADALGPAADAANVAFDTASVAEIAQTGGGPGGDAAGGLADGSLASQGDGIDGSALGDGGSDAASPDSSPVDAAPVNDVSSPVDAGAVPADSAIGDATSPDASGSDAYAADTGAQDSAAVDIGNVDAGGLDTNAADAGKVDAQVLDANASDASASDAKADSGPDIAPPVEPGACKKPGMEACGKTIAGETAVLYVCKNNLMWKPLQTCQKPCQPMPEGVPDRCPEDLEVPGSLVTKLDVKPYVEQSCKPTTYKAWPYAAQKCTYSMLGLTTTVTTATPPPETVAAWIVDAAAFMPAVWALRYRDANVYKKALKVVADGVLMQSSRVFPLEGGVIEQMSGMAAPSVFNFYHGITQNCTTGCYCRINSLQKQSWCSYKQFLGKQSYTACMGELGSSGLTAAWAEQCLGNHINAWNATVNQHFRAKAHQFQQSIKDTCSTAVSCTPDEVLTALEKAAL